MIKFNGDDDNDLKCIVKVSTSTYITCGKLRTVKDVYTLKRKSTYDLLHDELCNVGDEVIINNLDEVDDGEYELVTCNHEYDREGGFLDGWELMLVEA
jgi:hypothetical protein